MATAPVIGSDGIVPVHEPNDRWRTWAKHQVWDGTTGTRKWVPNVLDFVIDVDTYTTYIVDSLDPVTLIPILREIRPNGMVFSFSENDILFGTGAGTQESNYRLYVDKSVMPYVMAVDVRCIIPGSQSHKAKIFKGSDLAGSGKVISKVFDSSGVLVSEAVNLEVVSIDSHMNYTAKTVRVCHTTENIIDGDIVTLVIYSDAGHVVLKRQLKVEITSFIRSVDVSHKYITAISCRTAFMSPTDDHLIEFPLNVPVNALNLIGRVNYSDGSHVDLPVDGEHFSMHGLNSFVSSIPGQHINLVLNYKLGAGELAYSGVSTDGYYITEPYTLRSVNPNNSYAVKLFGYPYFISPAVGYEMRWWLFNLDRNIYFDVTPYVQFNSTTGPFNPKGYGYLQRKSISLNLQDVSGSFRPFVHTQVVDITLNSVPGDSPNEWTVSHEVVPGRTPYGLGVRATKPATTSVNISCGLTVFNEWKELLYKNIYPIINPVLETEAPEPTHFVISYASSEVEFPINNWNLPLNIGVNVPYNQNIAVRFLKRTSNGDLQLGIAVLLVKV